MAIDTGGTWWVGTSASDIEAYLKAYADEETPVSTFRLARCHCSSIRFKLDTDSCEGSAKRICVECSAEHFICDSGEHWNEAEREHWGCSVCESENANIGVAFSLYPDGNIQWVYVGTRCVSCGVLDCFAGWKVVNKRSGHLVEHA
ncbi:hypothetical protein [Phyllobacterium myrsinacearum]|uniref:Uncharacterized protein n=1 Tax=Phyllobacterium myrsinacearum TaxID=28101 RepID=A0A839EIQ2_9HYPH|nr:hypothetical protein [Phyllobacterium myrsinacearum]MBA8876377.1 hypothetical protein [Phyllobacterium myrsinacearum]